MDIQSISQRVAAKDDLDMDEALAILSWPITQMDELFEAAAWLREQYRGMAVDTCAIVNAKSDRCSEDCGFCSQSARYETTIDAYELMSVDSIVAEAKKAEKAGARHFGVVMAQKGLRKKDIPTLTEAFQRIASETSMVPGASLGFVDKEDMKALKESGLHCFNHNLETSRNYFPSVVSTHTFDERVATLRAAKEVGFEVCSGGIFGMGESDRDRVDLAMTLKEIGPATVPLNFLHPVPGTPMAGHHDLTPTTCLRIIAMFRFAMPRTNLAVCGGRELNLKERQKDVFRAGASHIMVGNYLTTSGRDAEDDKQLIAEQGLQVMGPQDSESPNPHTFPATEPKEKLQSLPMVHGGLESNNPLHTTC